MVISEGEDFEKRYELLAELNRVAEENVKKKDAVVAAGLSDFVADTDQNLRMIFERADLLMYQRKKELKELEKNSEAR